MFSFIGLAMVMVFLYRNKTLTKALIVFIKFFLDSLTESLSNNNPSKFYLNWLHFKKRSRNKSKTPLCINNYLQHLD